MSSQIPQERPTLLVIDDEAAIAGLVQTTATDVGFEASATSEGIDFSRPEILTPDLIVLDLQMPGRDGVETIRDLAAHRRGACVFLMSGLGDRMLSTASELAASQGLRVVGFLSKPFSYDDLFEALLSAKNEIRELPEAPKGSPVIAPEELRDGIRNGEIQIYYQPIIRLDTGESHSMEVLARWNHPRLGILGPADFVPVAERNGFGDELNFAVLAAAVADMSSNPPRCPLPVSVNFNADDFSDLGLPDRIAGMISAAALPASSLVVEITESCTIRDLPRALDTMMRLHMKGIGVWLDDFGTGYSSMEQLRRLPVSALKIDRSFVAASDTPDGHSLLEGLVALARKLRLPVVVEGVETESQKRMLRSMGCEYAQGFLIGRPMSVDSLPRWLASHNEKLQTA